MTKPGLAHLDETGQACERHPSDLEVVLHLAAIGARTPSFNHDIASKIQGVMMAVDEISELASTDEVRTAAETAQTALRELNQLLQQHRALTKPPAVTRAGIQELLTRAAQRAGVRLEGDPVPAVEVDVAVPLATQALTLAIDNASGLERRRTLQITARVAGDRLALRLPIAETARPVGELLAIAAWSLARSSGALRCGAGELVIELPIAQ